MKCMVQESFGQLSYFQTQSMLKPMVRQHVPGRYEVCLAPLEAQRFVTRSLLDFYMSIILRSVVSLPVCDFWRIWRRSGMPTWSNVKDEELKPTAVSHGGKACLSTSSASLPAPPFWPEPSAYCRSQSS